MVKPLFFGTEESKKRLSNLRSDIEAQTKLHDKYLSQKSDYFKQAEKEYYKNHENDDDGYGFSHYEWRKGGKAYDAAYKQYENASKDIEKRIKDQEKTILDSALSDSGNKSLSDIPKGMMNYYRWEFDAFVRSDEVVHDK